MGLRAVDAVISNLQQEDPDVPVISEAALQFIHAVSNYSYVSKVGALEDLRRAGHSEAFTAGFVEGLQWLSNTMSTLKEMGDDARKSSSKHVQL